MARNKVKQVEQPVLHVKAVKGLVRHVNPETGVPLNQMKFVGRDNSNDHAVLEGGELVSYHQFYINELKSGALAPLDLQTAQLAGVPFVVGE